jgi:hypothetical protein
MKKSAGFEQLEQKLNERQQAWLDASVEMANMFPHAWKAINEFLRTTRQMTNLLLTDFVYEPYSEVITYEIVESGHSTVVKIEIPVSVLVESNLYDTPDGIVEWLESDPSGGTAVEALTKEEMERKQLEQALRNTQNQFPGMYIDIPRMIELDREIKSGVAFKGDVTESMQ